MVWKIYNFLECGTLQSSETTRREKYAENNMRIFLAVENFEYSNVFVAFLVKMVFEFTIFKDLKWVLSKYLVENKCTVNIFALIQTPKTISIYLNKFSLAHYSIQFFFKFIN